MAEYRAESAAGGATSRSPEKNDGGGGRGRGAEISELRRRWELASVLDFLSVFEAVIGGGLEISAEEIEAGLISRDTSLAKLHITLLKGIPPLSKGLDGSDAWVSVLCKKLAAWWPWVAEGEIPLIEAKGDEISGYKELGPTDRLVLLRALCEIRAEQDDAVAYINDALKEGTKISSFRKEKIAGDENGTSFWYEGSTKVGPRLYKAVEISKNKKSEGKNCSNLPSFRWETLATNLKEFRNVVDEFSSSKVAAETVAVWTVETQAIPLLEKLQKRKEQAEKRKQRREMFLNYSKPFYTERATRSCRNRKPVNYRNDEFDQIIKEAIRETNKKTGPNKKDTESNDDSETQVTISASADGPTQGKIDPEDEPSESESSEEDDIEKSAKKDGAADINKDYAYSDVSYSDTSDFRDSAKFDKVESKSKKPSNAGQSHFGVRWSSRLAGDTAQSFVENGNLGTKNMLRQRSILNSALVDPVVVSDSEDDS